MPLRFGKLKKAKKITGSLIAAFPEANPPLVWKFDLEKNHSFTLSLQGEDGDWELGVTSPRGEFYPVARFLARDDAEEAFLRAQRPLFRRDYNFWRVVGPICAILVAWLLLMNFLNSVAHHMGRPPLDPNAPQASTHVEGPASPKEGVPLPADQVVTPPP